MRIRGRLRWWHAALLTLLGVVGVALVASWAIVRFYGPTFTRERVEALLTEALGQPVRLGAVRLRPLLGRVSLDDLEIGAGPAAAPGMRVRAGTIDVSIDIASLWRRQLTVSAVATDLHLDFTVPATSGGGPALFPLPESFEAGPVRIGIGRVGIAGGDVVIRMPESGVTLEIASPDVTARPVAGDLEVSGRLGALRVDAGGRREQFDQVTLDGRLAADIIRLRQIVWRWQGEALRLVGEIRRPWVDDREVSLRLDGDLAFTPLAHAAGSDQTIDGKIQVAIEAQWARQTLRLTDVRARFGDARLRGRLEAAPQDGGATRLALDLREVVLPGSLTGLGPGTVVAEGRARDGGVDLTRARADWRGLAVSLAGRIASGSSLAMHATLTADLKELARVLNLGSLAGRATVSADLTGRGPTPAIEGRAAIADLVAEGHVVEPVETTFRFAPSPGPDSRWEGTVQSPRVRWDEIVVESISASLAVDGQRLQVTRARARAAAVPIEATGAWEWAGSGRGHAELGPVSLPAITGIPPALGLAGTGRATVDASVDRGVVSATGVSRLDQVSVAGVSLGAGQAEVRVRGAALDGALSFPGRRLRVTTSGRLETGAALGATLALDELPIQPLLRELGAGAADQIDGRVSSRAEASIPLAQPARGRGVLRVTPDGLRVLGEPWASPGPIVLRWEGPRVVVERLRLEGPAGRLDATGALVDPERRGLSIALTNARLPGALGEIGRGEARAEVRLGGGDVELSQLDAQWPGLTAAASGRLQGDGAGALTARVESDLARLGPALGITGLGGRATLAADARGRSDALEAIGSLRAPQIQLPGATVNDLDLPLRLSRSSLRIENGQARLGESRLSADASATWPSSGPLTAEVLASQTQLRGELRAPAARLEDISPLLPAAARGRGALALTARGEGTPRAWRATGTLTSPLVEIGPGPLRQLRALFALDPARIEVTELSVDALGVPTRGTATWGWAGGGSAKATLGPASLAGLAMVPPGAGLRGTGRATIDAAMSSAADVTGTARVVLDDVAVGDAALGRGQLDASAQNGAVRADLAFPDPRLQVSARGRVDAAGMLDAEVTSADIDLARVARLLGSTLNGIGGTLAARATARVPLAEPRRGDGVVSIDPLRLVAAGDTWESPNPVQLRWAQGTLSLAEFRLTAKKDGFVSGAGTVSADGRLDGRASAQLPLDLLTAMRPEIRESDGVLDLSVRASGTLSAPTFVGDGAVHRASLLFRDRPEALRDIEARFALSTQGVQVKDATASMGGGRVQAQGALALQGWQAGGYRFKLQAKNVALGEIEGFSSAWDADLELSGLTREAQLTGQARLVRGAYRRDLTVLSVLMSPAQAASVEPTTPMRLRIRADLDDNLVVRSRSADLRAGGVLNVEGTTARPIVFGSVESRDGRITFRGRDWSVTNASVRFADPRRLDPYLEVLATSRIAEYDVTMQVTGPVSNITVRFSSTPRLSQNDLLSLVAFGATGAALRESPVTVLLGEAGKLLATNVLGVEPGVSGLRISTTSSSDRASELHGFPGEEQRSPVGPSRNSPGGRSEKVHIEYQLWAPLYLSGEYDREYGYGADVVLRFRFR
jgi:autotransporter translocation and assembly factor TamB